jgi:predicted transcriptional regulator of viral defense system
MLPLTKKESRFITFMNLRIANETKRIVELLGQSEIVRARELSAQGVHPMALQRLVEKGVVEREGRGLYRLAGAEVSEHYSLLQAAKRVPQGVICLLSALRFHQLTTQKPFEVWLMLERGSRRPAVDAPPLRVHYLSGEAFRAGIEEHAQNGSTLRVYSPAKTVADCFKFRYKIGMDVALEALRETLRQKRATVDDIWRYAELCRVARVIYPYLEALD